MKTTYGGTRAKEDHDIAEQQIVDTHFKNSLAFWNDAYQGNDLRSTILQDRRNFVLSQVNLIGLERDASVLEVGCGAGALAVSLAERYAVTAVDTVPEMLETARQRVRAAGLDGRITLRLDDANSLSFRAGTFDLVIAIGVLPWLRDITKPLVEFGRVLRPGGHLVVTIDNTWALNRIVDPRLIPAVDPLKRFTRKVMSRLGIRQESASIYFRATRTLDRAIAGSGFKKKSGVTLGFGPITVLARDVLPDRTGIALHRALQRAADRRCPFIRSTGTHYIVVANKE
jgi:ubiquinone/menaquinone biosynthesis C-methylase UbiE